MTAELIRASDIAFNPLEDLVMLEVVPPMWNGAHVATRIADAFATLNRMPGGARRASMGFWPVYPYAWEDLLAQAEQHADEQAREQRIANRSRSSPDIEEVTRMERAIYWPMHYLARLPILVRAVNAMSFARAIDRDCDWLARKRGGDPSLWQRKHWLGCEVIAQGLTRDKVGVF